MVVVSSPIKARSADHGVSGNSMARASSIGSTPKKDTKGSRQSVSVSSRASASPAAPKRTSSSPALKRTPSIGSTPRKGDKTASASKSSPLRVGSFASPMKKRSPSKPAPVAKGQTGFPVYVHVYDLGPVSKWILNSWAARNGGSLGVFHVGVEVLGIEFSFQAMVDCKPDDDVSGLTWHHPKSHPRHVYRETVLLGPSPLGVLEIGSLLEKLEKAWPASSYNCLSHNCTDFAEVLVAGLKVSEPFPFWVHGLAKGITKSSSLSSLSDISKQMDMFAACGSCASCGSCGSCGSCSSCGSCGPVKAVNVKAQEMGAAAVNGSERPGPGLGLRPTSTGPPPREQGREASADDVEEIFPNPVVNRNLFPQD